MWYSILMMKVILKSFAWYFITYKYDISSNVSVNKTGKLFWNQQYFWLYDKKMDTIQNSLQSNSIQTTCLSNRRKMQYHKTRKSSIYICDQISESAMISERRTQSEQFSIFRRGGWRFNKILMRTRYKTFMISSTVLRHDTYTHVFIRDRIYVHFSDLSFITTTRVVIAQ